MTRDEYLINFGAYIEWLARAEGPGGCTFTTIGQVASHIYRTLANSEARSIVSGAPNRVPGTVIYWTAVIDHDSKTVTVTHIEPEPRPGL